MKRLLSSAFFLLLLTTPAWASGWSLQDKDGVRYDLSSLHGKWVLVNFWAPWCPSCLQEIPGLITVQKQHADLLMIGVAVMYRSKKEVMEIVQNKAITYPIVLGNEDIASDFGGMTGMPTSFLYSPTGQLVGRHEGPVSSSELEQAMNGGSTAFTP